MIARTRQNVTPTGTLARALWCAGLLLACLAWAGCNSPYDESEERSNTHYRTFRNEWKTLDSATVYGEGSELLYLTTECLFQYHLLKQPYQLQPLTAKAVPEPETVQVTWQGKPIEAIAYTIRVKPGIPYNDHPCFVAANRKLSEADVAGVWKVSDLKKTATRELKASDYAHAIRRLADPRLVCPILKTLEQNILGMKEYGEALAGALEAQRTKRQDAGGNTYNRVMDERLRPIRLDYEAFPLQGVEADDKGRTLRLYLKQPYPQMLYWMALPFFTPVPPEATDFFDQPLLAARMITFDQNVVGTGPYRVTEYDATNQIVLDRNPGYRKGATPRTNPEAFYPTLSQAEVDALPPGHHEALRAEGMLEDAGRRLPILDRIVFRMEKEWVPTWNKFLQGYYDSSDIGSDTFDQAVTLTSQGDPNLSDDMRTKGIRLQTAPNPGISYFAFNMSDPVVGGYGEKAKKLRQAIAIAFDMEEYVAIFDNNRAAVAHSPVPPGLFGFEGGREGMNEKVYRWDERKRQPVRRSLKEAKELLAEAGYPDGFDANGQRLTIRFDNLWADTSSRPRIKFIKNQFGKLGIVLENNSVQSSMYWAKVIAGNFQFIRLGWGADYPDVENFYFLAYGGNAKDKERAENASNYQNKEFDRLFEQSKPMPNGAERQKIIHRMNDILQDEAPWLFGQHGINYSLVHEWCGNAYPNAMASNRLKYMSIDFTRRAERREEWNRPNVWPIVIFLGALLALAVPAFWLAARHMRET